MLRCFTILLLSAVITLLNAQEKSTAIKSDAALSKPSQAASRSFPKIKPDFKVNGINGAASASQYSPTMAVSKNGNSLVAWLDRRDGIPNIYAQYFNSFREAAIGNVKVNDESYSLTSRPLVSAGFGNNFIISWQADDNKIIAQVFNGQSKTGCNFRVNPYAESAAALLSVCLNNSGNCAFLFTTRDDEMHTGVRLLFYSLSSNKFSDLISLDTFEKYGFEFPDLSESITSDTNGNFAVAWKSWTGSNWKIRYARFDMHGRITGPAVTVGYGDPGIDYNAPVIQGLESGRLLIYWGRRMFDQISVNCQYAIADLSDNVILSSLSFNAPFVRYIQPVGSWRRDKFALGCFDSKDYSIVYLDSNGNVLNTPEKISSPFTIPNATSFNHIPQPGNFYILANSILSVWTYSPRFDSDIYLALYENPISSSSEIKKINDDSGSADQRSPITYLAPDGNYLICWTDLCDGYLNAYCQVFDSLGSAHGSNLLLSDNTDCEYNYISHIRYNSKGTFIVSLISYPESYLYRTLTMKEISTDGRILKTYYSDLNLLSAFNMDSFNNMLLVYPKEGSFRLRKLNSSFNVIMEKEILPPPPEGIERAAITFDINKNLDVCAVWRYDSVNNNNNNQISSMTWNDSGGVILPERIIDLSILPAQYISGLSVSLSDENPLEFAVGWNAANETIIKRWADHGTGSMTAFTSKIPHSSAGGSLAFLKYGNKKLFAAWYEDFKVFAKIFNDNRLTEKQYTLHDFRLYHNDVLVSYYQNSISITNDILLFAYVDNKTAGTGMDIWANVQETGDELISAPEPLLYPVNKNILINNYPNPFNAATKITYGLNTPATVKISIYDCLGRKVRELVNERQEAGYHTVEFNGAALPSGVYFCGMESPAVITKKIILLR